jgi:hypothetical protein
MRDLNFIGPIGSRLRDQGVATFVMKSDAAAFARKCGWFRRDVIRAADRFFIFYVVGQSGNAETIRLLAKDRSVIETPHPGYW